MNLRLIIDILAMDDWYVDDEDIKIAKGKYKTPYKLKDIIEKYKRR
jgi:hypothetical protein